jgi:hypothetical protein
MKRSSMLVLLLVMFFVGACGKSSQASVSKMPDIGIPIENANEKVKLSAPGGWNPDGFKLGRDVSIAVEVISNDRIAYDRTHGVRLFIGDNERWIEVENLMKYPDGYIILSPKVENPLNVSEISVAPNIPNGGKAVTLRIILVGHIYQNDEITDETTVAYIDVRLEP